MIYSIYVLRVPGDCEFWQGKKRRRNLLGLDWAICMHWTCLIMSSLLAFVWEIKSSTQKMRCSAPNATPKGSSHSQQPVQDILLTLRVLRHRLWAKAVCIKTKLGEFYIDEAERAKLYNLRRFPTNWSLRSSNATRSRNKINKGFSYMVHIGSSCFFTRSSSVFFYWMRLVS